MKRLACDSPVSGKRGRVCSVFLQQAAHHGENGWQTQETANAHLDKVDIGLRVRFEHGDPLTGKARFDAFPLVNDTMVNKGMVAKRVFPSFASVVYTGDQPLGNDQPVFEYVKTQTRMSAHAVSGPEAVVNLIGTMCPARWIRVETATRTKKHPGAALPTT